MIIKYGNLLTTFMFKLRPLLYVSQHVYLLKMPKSLHLLQKPTIYLTTSKQTQSIFLYTYLCL